MSERMSDEDLVAFLDGEIEGRRYAEVEAAIAADPALAAYASQLTASAGQLREAFDEVMREPVPARLLLAARGAADAPALPRADGWTVRLKGVVLGLFRSPRQWAPLASAAAVGGIVLGSSLGYMATTPAPTSGVLDSLTGAHNLLVASANAGEPAAFDLPAGSEQKLPADIHVPDMKPFGLSFRGTKKAVVDGKQAYQFYYTSASKQPGPLAIFVWKTEKSDQAPTFDRHNNQNVVYWRQRGYGYAIVGEADKGYLTNMSQDIAWQLHSS